MSTALQELAKYQQKVAALQKQLSKENQKLLALPAKFGFKSVNELIAALQAASGSTKSAPSVKAGKTPSGRKARVAITPEIKAKVRSLANDGKTGAEIAAAVGVSLPSVQNIKKELGLVKARKSKK